MTGWQGGDPARYVTLGEGIEISPLIWDLWEIQSLTLGAGYWQLHGTVDSVLPNSGNNNLPRLEVRWDSDGVWRGVGGFQSGSIILASNTESVRPSIQTTISFRTANVNDFILGLYTPRSFSGMNLTVASVQQDPITELFGGTVLGLGFGKANYSGFTSAVAGGQRSYVQFIG